MAVAIRSGLSFGSLYNHVAIAIPIRATMTLVTATDISICIWYGSPSLVTNSPKGINPAKQVTKAKKIRGKYIDFGAS